MKAASGVLWQRQIRSLTSWAKSSLPINRTFRGAGLGLACAISIWLLTRIPLLQGLESSTLDARFSYRETRPSGSKDHIILIDIDKDSLRKISKLRANCSPELATVVEYLNDNGNGANAIGIDFLLTDETTIDPKTGDPEALGRAVRNAGNVVLPQYHDPEDGWQRPSKLWLLNEHRQDTELGFINLTEDDDQFVRRQQLLTHDGTENVTQFAFALFICGQKPEKNLRADGDKLWLDNDQIPLDSEQRLRINFVGPPGTFVTKSFQDIYDRAQRKEQLLDQFRGSIVIIGVSGQEDAHPTPYSNLIIPRFSRENARLMSGMELHANIIATLADRDFITTPFWLAPLPLLVTFGVLMGIGFAHLGLKWGTVLACGLPFAWSFFCMSVFAYYNWWIEISSVVLLNFLTYAVTSIYCRDLKVTIAKIKTARKIKILFLAANPLQTTPLRLDEEVREIEAKIRAADYRDSLELITKWAVRPDDLLQYLNQYKPHIVHFSGHGSASEEIILLDESGQAMPVSKQALVSLFRALRGDIRVVLLNACYSRPQAASITEYVDCAIGMSKAIGDKAAITFAASFYRAIGFGCSVQNAFDQGTAAILLQGIPEDKTPELVTRRGTDAHDLVLVSLAHQSLAPYHAPGPAAKPSL